MEIAGLVVIIILITLGLLFMAQFALKSDHKKKIFTREGLAYSTMGALMQTTIQESDCQPLTSHQTNLRVDRHLLKDCASWQSTAPYGHSDFNCQGKHSCVFLQELLVDKLLKETLAAWNKNYEFKSELIIPGGEAKVLVAINQNLCNKKEKDSSGIFPLSAEGVGRIESELIICD